MAKSWKFLALLNLAFVSADVLVYPKGEPFILVADFYDLEANFGEDVPKRGISTGVVVASNEHACEPILPPPNIPNPPGHWAVLIRRYNCSFEEKVINAQNAFYDVAIVHNVDSNKLEIMNASHPELIHIMAIFISANTAREIRTKYLYDQGYIVQISPNSSSDILSRILIPFIIVISACFILMVGFMVAKCIKDYRRARRRRMPYSTLNKIPTTKYRKNDPYETCAICLDDFIEGEKLRVLPCSHAYHSKCIDPWLTRNRRVCPMCKRKVFAADERVESDVSSSEDDDHTPLLRGRNAPGHYYSTDGRPARDIREVLQTLRRQREQMRTSERQERGSSSSGTSTYSSVPDETRYLHQSSLIEQIERTIDSVLNDTDSDLDPHHEDHHHHEEHHHHGQEGNSGQPDSPQNESHEGPSMEEPGDSTHHGAEPTTDHEYGAWPSDSHHDVTFNDDTNYHSLDC